MQRILLLYEGGRVLTIYFGDMDGVIDNTSVYFNNT